MAFVVNMNLKPKFLSWTQNLSLFSGSHARRGSQAMAVALAKSHNEAG